MCVFDATERNRYGNFSTDMFNRSLKKFNNVATIKQLFVVYLASLKITTYMCIFGVVIVEDLKLWR